MKTKFSTLSILVLLSMIVLAANATLSVSAANPYDLIINEWSQGPSDTAGEWVELLVVDGPINLQGWDLVDGNGSATLTFSSDPLWNNVPTGSLIVVYNGSDPDPSLPADDTDLGDYVVIIPHNNSTYFGGNWPFFSNSTPSDNPHLRDETDSTVHDFTAAPGTSVRPGSSESVHYTYNTNAPTDIANTSNWNQVTSGAGDVTPGQGNGGLNTAWVDALRGGSTAQLIVSKTGPGSVGLGEPFSYTLTVSNQTTDTLTSLTVRDTLPLSLTFHSAVPTATWDVASHTLTWTLPSTLSAGASLNYTINVTAPSTTTVVTNSQYVAWATEWPTPTSGPPVETRVTACNSIYNIQYTNNSGGDGTYPSLCEGEQVTVEGIVHATYSGRGFFIADDAGPWHSLYVYYPGGQLPALGDLVQVSGTVQEYYGMTELGGYAIYTVLSSGNPLYAPSLVTAAMIPFGTPDASEPYESVLVETHDITVTQGNDQYNIWTFTDASGGTGKGDDWGYDVDPNAGDTFAMLRGALAYDYDEYKVMPRDAGDLIVELGLFVDKSAPASVAPGAEMTYTLDVQNLTGISLTNVIVTDVVPANAAFARALDGGALVGNTVSWTLPSLADQSGASLRFVVTATDQVGAVISNTQYAVWASEWPTPSYGPPVATVVVEPGGLTSIYDIQYTTDPSGDSPLLGQVVTTTGVVYAVYGEGFAIAEASGPWHGLYVYYPSGAMPQIGDEVQVTGEVQEYYGMTELGNGATYLVLSSGHTPYAQSDVQTAEIATGAGTAESYESVLVATQNVTVTNPDLGYGEWEITDSSGVGARVDDWGSYSYTPAQDDLLYLVRGMLNYSFSDFKIEPRDDADIVQAPPTGLLLSKTAPYAVAAGAEMTYTLDVQNWTGITLTGVIVTDALPANAAFARALDGGLLAGDTVSWTVPSLAHQDSLSLRFVVTATGPAGELINNATYAVWAANWPTPTLGDPVLTAIGDYIPIYLIQGDGFRSPFEGQTVETVGVIGGFFEGNYPGSGQFDGFYVQDAAGDGITSTSDGLFVQYDLTGLNLGDLVTVTGQVQEFGEYDAENCPDDECLTQILASSVQAGGAGSLPTTVLDPPGDPDQAALYWEALEGMLVTLPNTATVVGPTSYGTVMAVRGDLGIDRVMRTGPYEGMPVGVRHYERFGDIGGADAPDLIVGSTIQNADGPLAFSYGNYLVTTQAGDAWQVVTSEPLPAAPETWPAAGPDQFSLASFNTLNFDGGSDPEKMGKVISTVLQLNGPTFLGLQEIDVSTVMTDLLTGLAANGYDYDYAYSHPDVGGHGVALLWRTDRVSDVTWSTQYQGCSPYGSQSSEAYDDYCPAEDEYPLFSRRPVVLTGTVGLSGDDMQVVVIANHFKSKLGGTPADLRRLGQGQLINDLVIDLVAAGSAHVAVLGDLNDFEDAPPLEAIYANGAVTNTWYTRPLEERYSYIYNGVSQILDHILTTPSLYAHLIEMNALHYNADYPFGYSYDGDVIWRTSDHEPVAANFSQEPLTPWLGGSTKTVAPGSPVQAGDRLTYTVSLSNSGATATVSISDALPAELLLVSGFEGGGLSWTGTVTGGQAVQLHLVAQVDPNLSLTTTVSNALTIDDGVNAPFQIASPETTLLPATPPPPPDLSASTKTVTPGGPVQAGDRLTYTVSLSNSGATATVSLVDVLPDELLIVEGFGGGTALMWTGTVTGESQVVLTLVAQVDPNLSLTTTVSNALTIDDGVNAPFEIHSPETTLLPAAPTLYQIYLPLVVKNN